MGHRRRAFTLSEMLTVLAIVLVLSAILFPVFRSAKASSHRAVCASNLRQIYLANMLYATDYSDRFVVPNHRQILAGTADSDRTWVQLTMPYLSGEFNVFRCPSDPRAGVDPVPAFDPDLVPGDTFARYYQASMRTNAGYNYLVLSPIVLVGGTWMTLPVSTSELGEPSKTLMFIDSVWDRDEAGRPFGGGSWLVVPPCRFSQGRNGLVDSFGAAGGREVYSPSKGWSTDPNSAVRYGFAWGWHEGRANLVASDGSLLSRSIARLAEGCDVKADWRGGITDPGRYLWDAQ